MNKELAWVLGYLLSDGSIIRPKYRNKGDESHLHFICKYSDREVLYKIKDILETKAEVHTYPEYKSPQAKIRIYDRRDIIEQYDDIKTVIPSDIIGFERHFIRGCVDGDGTLSYRASRNTFRVGYINEHEHIVQWVADTIANALNLPPKKARWVPQNNVYEILWEGLMANLIAFWLYHGEIELCSLERKRIKYQNTVLQNNSFNTYDDEMLFAVNAYIDDNNNEIAFHVPKNQTLDWCHRLQSNLSYNTIPVFHNKGKRKYYRLYIPHNSSCANTRGKYGIASI